MGCMYSDTAMPSMAITEQSSGTRFPFSLRARMAPIAITSAMVKSIQYLLIHPLLNKDIDSFMRYLIAVQEKVKYNPTVCQEGIIFAYTQRQQTVPEGFVNPTIQQSFKRFAQVYSQGGQNSPQLEAFKGTLWYYLMKE